MATRFNRDNALQRNYSTRVGMRDRRLTSPVRRRIEPIYTKFENGDVVQNAQADVITAAMWSNNDGELKEASSELYTSSVQIAAAGVYYGEIYRDEPQVTASAEPQFAVAYGNSHGSGSAPVSEYASEGMTPTKAIYQQYRNLLLAPGDDLFTVTDTDGTVHNETGSFFININRQRFKERIDPGNWEISISHSNFSTNGARYVLTDDSAVNVATLGDSGAIYKVVSGSMGTTSSNATQFGWLYPDMGVIMLSPRVMDYSGSINTNYCWCPGQANDVTTQVNPTVHDLIGMFTGSTTGTPSSSFAARSSEKVYSTHYFVRLKNSEYNFSNNPSFTSGSQGEFTHPSMYKDPHVYITTVGLYNNRNELLAIAKLSKPLLKSFTREALIRVKLEF
jgi:hypothetical protein